MAETLTFSNVLEHAAASPSEAARHFAARLSVETDPYDVHEDLVAGVEGITVVDPRSPEAFLEGHLPGAISIPHRQINQRTTAQLDRSHLIVVYCWGPGCNAGTKAGLKFAELGFRVKEMIGGYEYWVKEGYEVER